MGRPSPHDDSASRERFLRYYHIACLTYLSVGGGPFGFESVVASSSVAIAFVGLCSFCLFFAAPQALIVAELGNLFPRGYVHWVLRLLGSVVGVAHCGLRVFDMLFSVPTYAALCATYLLHILGATAFADWAVALVRSGFVVAVAVVTVFGVKTVSAISAFLTVAVLVPFLVFFGFSVPKLNIAPLIDFSWADMKRTQWGLCLSTLTFCLAGMLVMGFALRCGVS